MLPGIGGSELIIIAIVALVVVGPKDLPKLLRQLGRFVGKMRSMADDFKASFDDMARQSELDDLRKEVEALRSANPVSSVVDDVNSQMRALDSGIKDEVARLDAPAPEPVLDNPQYDGLPPRWDATVAPDNAPASVAPEAEPVVVKKPRAPRKAKPTVEDAPVVAEAVVTPVKRPRKKAAS